MSDRTGLQRLTRLVLAHKLAVVVLTAIAFAVGLAATAATAPSASEDYAYPGFAAYEANQEIAQTYGNGGYQRPFVPVVTLAEGQTVDSPGVSEALRAAFTAVAEDRRARVVSYADTGDAGFVGDNGRTTFGLVFPGPTEDGGMPGGLGETIDQSPMIVDAMRAELPPGATVEVTGLDTMVPGVDAGGLNVPVKLLIGALGAIVVLLFVFRSALAFVPLLISVVALPICFIFLFGLTAFSELHQMTLMTVPLIGLGIAVDYALIVVTRWREEQAGGYRGDEAVERAMATAGRSVLFSSLAVALGLLAMIVLPVPFLRGLGLGAVVIAAVSALVSLTLLPVILALAGRRLDRRRLRGRDPVAGEARAGRAWTAWARLVVRRRVPAAVASGGVLLALAIAGLGVNLSLPESRNLVHSGPGHDALTALGDSGVPSGALTSFDVLVPAGTDPDAVSAELAALPGIRTAVAPDNPQWRQDGTALVTVIPVDESGSAAGEATVARVIDAVPPGTQVGGNAAQLMNYIDHTYGAFPVLLGLVALVTFVLLARAFRSLLLALKAVVLNLLSLAAVMGAMVILWQWGWGTEWLVGIQATGSLGTFVPITIFAFLYGLSTDYEVFILARMREEYDRTGSTTEAVVRGIGRTGRLVTCAALILFIPFAALAGGGELDVAIFATGLGLGILLDATLVRAVLVPAVVAMMGRWNWWLPMWAARLLRVPASPLRETPRTPATPVGP